MLEGKESGFTAPFNPVGFSNVKNKVFRPESTSESADSETDAARCNPKVRTSRSGGRYSGCVASSGTGGGSEGSVMREARRHAKKNARRKKNNEREEENSRNNDNSMMNLRAGMSQVIMRTMDMMTKGDR